MKKSLLFVLVAAVFTAAGFSQVAHWPLDSDTRDIVGINHGTPTLNGVSFVNDPVRGDVMLLDGVEGFVTLPSNLLKDMDNATITCWFNFYGGAIWQRVWSFGHIDDPWAMLYFCPRDGWEGNNMHVTVLGLGRNWRDWNPTVVDTLVWHFAAAVFDADTFKFFLDDEMVIRNDSVPATPNEIMCDPNEAYLGKSHWADATYNGMIDDVRIYDVALSDAEVLALYAEGAVSVPEVRAEPDVILWAYNGRIQYGGVKEADVSSVRVYSITGQLVFQSEELFRLRENRFDPGLYVVNLVATEGIISKKVMIAD
jgi:hypothetical protein